MLVKADHYPHRINARLDATDYRTITEIDQSLKLTPTRPRKPNFSFVLRFLLADWRSKKSSSTLFDDVQLVGAYVDNGSFSIQSNCAETASSLPTSGNEKS